MRLGKTVFISYRGRHYGLARRLAEFLRARGACDRIVLVPPFSLTADSEVLLPYEFFELMEPIIDEIARADAFVVLPYDYFGSYFTQAELLQWRRFAKSPKVWGAEPSDDGRFQLTPFELDSMPYDAKALWASISTRVNKRMNGRTVAIWGRYARNCYLIPCRHCGEHILATKKVVEPLASSGGAFACPHCGDPVRLGELPLRGNYYRKPIVLRDEERTPMRPLGDDELKHLLVSDDPPPPAIRLVTLPEESVPTESWTLLKVFGGILAVGAAAAIVAGALLDTDDKK
jgi:hypothetical protein